jgi:hypothetical protein
LDKFSGFYAGKRENNQSNIADEEKRKSERFCKNIVFFNKTK